LIFKKTGYIILISNGLCKIISVQQVVAIYICQCNRKKIKHYLMKLLILTTAVGDINLKRRVTSLLDSGHNLSMCSMNRSIYTSYEKVSFRNRLDEDIYCGVTKCGVSFGRIFQSLKYIFTIFRLSITRRYDAIVCFYPDSAIIVKLFSFFNFHRVVYMISDLRISSEEKIGIGNEFFRFLENKVLHSCGCLVVTSPAFADDFKIRVPRLENKTLTLPNNLPSEFQGVLTRPSMKKKPTSRIRLGYVGYVRYAYATLPLLRSIADRSDKFELHIYGILIDAEKEILALIDKSSNIFYHGRFSNPEDLSHIYEDLDVNLAIYDNRDLNVRAALPNKLYESIFFGTPILVASNTYLSRLVTELEVGCEVCLGTEDGINSILNSLRVEDIIKWQQNCLAYPEKKLFLDMKPLENFISGKFCSLLLTTFLIYGL
jgi:glycosyltransferase involved in cell wall biosynthesis